MEARAGRIGSIEQLHADWAGALHLYAWRRLGDPGAAEEVVQDTLVRAWRHADRFDPERGSLPDWGLRAERWLAPTEPIRTDAPDLSRTGDGWTLNYPADSYYVELDFEQLLAGGMQIDDQAVPEGIRNIQWYGPPNGGVTIAGLANATSDDEFRTAAVVLGVPGDRQQESGLMHKADITYLASRHSLP